MKRGKYFSSLLNSVCEGLNSFFSSEKTEKKIWPMVRKKPYLSPLSKNGLSPMNFALKLSMGKFSWLYAMLLRSGIQ